MNLANFYKIFLLLQLTCLKLTGRDSAAEFWEHMVEKEPL